MTLWEIIALAKAGKGGAKSMLHFRGSVLTENDLPDAGNDGDVYLVDSADSYFAWDGEGWTDIGQILTVDDAADIIDGAIVVQDEMPTDPDNKVWYKENGTEIEIPTMEEYNDLKSAVNTLQPSATAQDVGKALIVKTVDPETGKPSAYDYGEAGGGGDVSNCAPVIIETVSGNIASFTDGANGLPVRNIVITGTTATITRTGKNLFDKDNITTLDNVYVSGMTIVNGSGNRGFILPCVPNTTYTLSLNVKNFNDLAIASFVNVPASGSVATAKGTTYSSVDDKVCSVTTGENDHYLFIKYNNINVQQVYTNEQVLAGLQVEVGAAATDYAPFSGETFNYPSETVTTLLGVNNIWADSVPIAVSYCADTKLYIDNKIAELQATVLENIGG